MCGIVGLFLKNQSLQADLGRLTGAMLRELCDRGPDSAGFAVYGGETAGTTKLCMVSRNGAIDWSAIAAELAQAIGAEVAVEEVEDHAIFRTTGAGDTARKWLIDNVPGAYVLSQGESIEIFKGVGNPAAIIDRLALGGRSGTHAIGHTRMATESAVTVAGSHPFSTGDDTCLVHNGSLSNHNRLREQLARHGERFQTDNDSEVAAAYLAARMRAGDTLKGALEQRPEGPRRLLHLRGRHARRLRGDPRSDRLQAGGDRRDRRLGRDGVGISRDRAAARRRAGEDLGARARDRLCVEPRRLMAASRNSVLDLAQMKLREVNQLLHDTQDGDFLIRNPRGAHALACGLDGDLNVTIDGHVGYYCAGMNKRASVTVNGNAGTGLAENMMSGRVHVKGDASQSAGATGCGGLLVIDGNASARCGIALRGLDIVVKGSVGHMSAFMAQAGNIVVLGDTGDAFGDSLYEARLFVRGAVKSLGADCVEKEMRDEHKASLRQLLDAAGADADVTEFRRYGSARKLYHFHVDNAGQY